MHSTINPVSEMESKTRDYSYANDSTIQMKIFQTITKPFVDEGINLLCQQHFKPNTINISNNQYTYNISDINNEETNPLIKIADLGCSHGPNTINQARYIISQLINHQNFIYKPLEIQYFFSDLPSNDFNSLFMSLNHNGNNSLLLSQIDNNDNNLLQLFLASVPGSFYGPLFPSNSLNFVFSSLALHWVSQVPPQVMEKGSLSWNGNHIWLHQSRPKVVEAYAQQFKLDMGAFLKRRVIELVRGGIIVMVAVVRSDANEYTINSPFDKDCDTHNKLFGPLEVAWQQMAFEGIITEEESYALNIPLYNFHPSELNDVIETTCAGELEVVKMESYSEKIVFQNEMDDLTSNPQKWGVILTKHIAGITKHIVECIIGSKRSTILYEKLQEIYIERFKSGHTSRSIFQPIMVAILRKC